MHCGALLRMCRSLSVNVTFDGSHIEKQWPQGSKLKTEREQCLHVGILY